jgi:CRISPR/Cas system CSM-associated protein Csm2 small subunit
MNQQFGEVHNLIEEERKKREESENAFVKNLEEIMDKVKGEFNKEKKQREEFEENVFNLIEDTCTKLASSNLEG